eukprot:jgi/Tetstr1/443577/TSEL_031576.t1
MQRACRGLARAATAAVSGAGPAAASSRAAAAAAAAAAANATAAAAPGDVQPPSASGALSSAAHSSRAANSEPTSGCDTPRRWLRTGRAHGGSVTAGLAQRAEEAAWRGADISPASLVHPSARIGAGASVGPFCSIGPGVSIGEGCRLMGHNVLMGNTVLGANNTLRQGAIIGSEDPGQTIIGEGNTFGHHSVVGARCQDLKSSPHAECSLRIGDGNDIREFVGIHRSSTRESETRIGNSNLIMGGCHVAHDVHMGSHNIVGNNSLFAGHVLLGDYVRVSGACAVQPRVVLGSYAYLTGGSMVDRDVQGDRAMVRGLNEVLMSRCGFSVAEKHDVRAAFQALWGEGEGTYSGLQLRAAQLLRCRDFGPHARQLLMFVCESLSQSRSSGRVGAVCHLMSRCDAHAAAAHRGPP